MKIRDQFRFVRQNMKRNKTRLFMTILATAMGCAFLIVLASVGFGLQQSIVDRIVGDRLVTSIQVPGKNVSDTDDFGLYEADMDYFYSVPGVSAATFLIPIGQAVPVVVDGTPIGHERMQMVDFDSEQSAGGALEAGRWPEAADEILIGYSMGESGEDAEVAALDMLGKTAKLTFEYYENGKLATRELEAVIVGVKEKPKREWLMDKTVYIHEGLLDQIEELTGTQSGAIPYFEEAPDAEALEEAFAHMPKASDPRQYHEVTVLAKNASQVKGISDTLREQGYYVYSVADEVSQINVFFMIIKIGLIFVGAIAVLIASIGIFNTMTMAVTERAQDIGIMKAIGAHPSVIKRVFLLESAMIGIIGAVFGTVVAYGISVAVNAGLPLLVSMAMSESLPEGFLFSVIPPYLALLACFISLAVAMLSGYRPAKRATTIDVLSALRRDI